ncbi:MAG TPA: hypothetical protein VKN18_17660 [Blastocatellia bacterium]|nr:hypothetical protein [Blastocatellia bacterium]
MKFGVQRSLICLSLLLTATGVFVAAAFDGQSHVCDRVKPSQLLTQTIAERMLGQTGRLTPDTTTMKGNVRQCACAYFGASKDKETGQDSVVYFSLEEKEKTPSAEEAKQVLVSTKEANAHDTDIVDLSGIGDEAFLLGNDPTSHLIMARKGGIIMRLQVKKAVGTRSLEESKAFAERVLKGL